MDKKRIGILRGVYGNHYENSLKKGGEIISYIFENLSDKYKVVDILVDKENILHARGLPIRLEDLANKIDLIWNVSHPNFASVLRNVSVPNLRIDNSSILEKNRIVFNNYLKSLDIQTPKHIILPIYQKDFDGPEEKYALLKAKEVFEKFASPWTVKSYNPNSNIGIHLAKTFPELVNAIKDVINHGESILIEELIPGKNVSVHSINNFRNENVYVLPPVEHRNEILISPANLSNDEKSQLISLAKNLHQYLNASHYVKYDFILHPKKGIYLSNIEFSPDLKENSSFIEASKSVGAKAHNLLDHIFDLSLNRKGLKKKKVS